MDEELDPKNPICDETGLCRAAAGERDITTCIYCGKELHEKDGAWYTWDAYKYSDPVIQCYVVE